MRSGIRQQPEASKWTEASRSAHDPVRASNRLQHYAKGNFKALVVDGYYNLFAPVQLGGLGVEAPQDVVDQTHFTFSQQLRAGAALHRLKLRRGGFMRESDVRTGYESQVLRESSRVRDLMYIICVYIYIYIYMYTYFSIYVYVCVYIYMYIYLYMHLYLHLPLHICIYACIYV